MVGEYLRQLTANNGGDVAMARVFIRTAGNAESLGGVDPSLYGDIIEACKRAGVAI